MREYVERAVLGGGRPGIPDTPERSRLERARGIREGAELLGYGAFVFGVPFVAGHFIPALFGHAPVAAG